MPVALRSLRVVADMDAGAYARGAEQKVAADRAMTGSSRQVAASTGQVIDVFERTGRSASGLDRDLDRLLRRNDAVYRSTQELARGQGVLTRAFERGKIDAAEYSRQLDLLQNRLLAADRAQDRLSTGGRAGRIGGIGMIGSFGAGLGLGMFTDPTMIVTGINRAVSAVDDLGDAAEKAGISSERLQVLRFAMEQTVGSAEQADSAMQRFSRGVGEAALTGGGPLAKAFEAMGISLRDAGGEVRSTSDLFDEFSKKFPRIASQAQQAGISARAFGREAGSAMAVTLGGSVDALGEFEDQLRGIGGVMSGETIAAADKLDREFKQLQTTMSVGFKTAAIAVGQAFSDINQNMEKLGQQTTDFFNNPSGRNLMRLLFGEGAADAVTDPTAGERVRRAFEDLPGADAALQRELQRRAAERRGDTINIPEVDKERERAEKKAATELERGRERAAEAIRDQVQAMRKRREAQEGMVAAAELELGLLGRTVGEAARLKTHFDLILDAAEAVGGVEFIQPGEVQRIEAAAEAMGRLAEQSARASLARDLAFERAQLGRSEIERAVQSQLRSSGLDENDQMAGQIRFNEQLQKSVDLLDEARGEARGLFSDLLRGAREGDIEGAIASFADRLAGRLDDAVSGMLTDALFGAQGTTGEGSPLGGFFQRMFGPKMPAGGLAVPSMTGTMDVTAGVVNVGGVSIPSNIFTGAPVGGVTSRDLPAPFTRGPPWGGGVTSREMPGIPGPYDRSLGAFSSAPFTAFPREGTALGYGAGAMAGSFRGAQEAGMSLLRGGGVGESAIVALIRRVEGTAGPNGYNTTLANGLLTGGERNLTGMTLDQIDALQTSMLRNPSNRWNSSAVGAPQVVRTTLRGLRGEMGLTGSELFDEDFQNSIFERLLARREGQGVAGLRNEWEGLQHVDAGKIQAALAESNAAVAQTATQFAGGFDRSLTGITEATGQIGQGFAGAFNSQLGSIVQGIGGQGGGGGIGGLFGGLFGGGGSGSPLVDALPGGTGGLFAPVGLPGGMSGGSGPPSISIKHEVINNAPVKVSRETVSDGRGGVKTRTVIDLMGAEMVSGPRTQRAMRNQGLERG